MDVGSELIMNFLIEKVLIPMLILVCIAFALYNPMQLDPLIRIIGTIAVIFLLLFLVGIIHRQNTRLNAANVPDKLTSERQPTDSGRHNSPNLGVPTHQTPPTQTRIGTIDIKRIEDLYKTHTNVQADLLTRHYVGQKITLSGIVREVSKYIDGQLKVFLTPDNADSLSILRFNEIWNSHLYTLERQAHISVIGTIYSVDRSGVNLEDCEIV
jgi:hypothetical protein